MALTYKKIMSTDYGKLTAAAKAWDDMATELKKAESAYAAATRGLSLGSSSWQGLAQSRAYANFQGTQYEYGAAQKQAKAIADLLRDAHGQFTELKQRLDSVVADARKDKMAVDAEGSVRPDLSADVKRALVHDPDGQTLLAQYNRAAQSWEQQIQKYVKAFEDADAGVKLALTGAVKDSNKESGGKDATPNGFNAGAKGDIEQYEMDYAKDVTTRINNGEKVSTAEVENLSRILRDNNNEAFEHRTKWGQTFLSGLGADGTLKLANRLDSLAHFQDKDGKKSYESVKTGIANSIAAASHDAHFRKQWLDEMKKVGTSEYVGPAGSGTPAKGSEGKVRGYQILMGVMERTDGKNYDGQFLKGLTQDIYSAEKASKGDIWDVSQQYGEKNASWFVNDPLDSSLGLLSKHPKEATEFLDPGSHSEDDVKKSPLNYLLRERDWNGIVPEYSEWGTNHETSRVAHGMAVEDGDARTGFGAALEAGATGRPAGSPVATGPHSEAEARILDETIKLLDKDGKGDEIAENLKVPLGRTLNSYAGDVFQLLGGESPDQNGDKSNSNSGGSHITSDEHSLIRVMRGVSDGVIGSAPNGEPIRVFDALYEAQKGQAAEHLAYAKPVPTDQANNVVADWNIRSRNVGEAMGTMTGIGSDMLLDNRDAQVGRINDTARYAYHAGGGILNFIPGVGDAAQRTVDAITYEWSKDVTTEADLAARTQDSRNTAQGKEGTRAILDAWATQQGVNHTDGYKNSRDISEETYRDGREDAFTALRTRK
ncbi:hypothetical protein [Streptomyces sp. CC77]|uniref:hypothetical protein n=1 Tax=Streptomyces sp. CC77 TaxID=1906739 RepID=UPI0008DDFE8A|nr:hypothetical protein [Streptomyces sp. CC77]OII69148.1 hypothetical protein BJP39_18640 [Streptomyces sp. CC77]